MDMSLVIAIIAGVATVIQAFVAVVVWIQTRNMERRERRQLTITVYNDLYRNVLMKLEVMGTAGQITKQIQEIMDTAPGNFEADPRAKEFKQLMNQIDLFAQELLPQGKVKSVLDWETFARTGLVDFNSNMIPRIEAYYKCKSTDKKKHTKNMPEATARLIKKCEVEFKRKYHVDNKQN